MPALDFAALPPETNSARMYTGPGTGSLLAAAGAWRALAGELNSAASAYQAMIAELTGQAWFGPASEAMAAATGPYAAWLGRSAGLAEQTANRMTLAAGAFEQAFAATVPPAAIAANRARLAALVAADVLGQNSAEIAATEAEYGQMWLQDATAMYGYAAGSAAATAVQPFHPPPPVTGPAGQGAAVTQAGTGGAQNQLSQLLNAIPQTLHGLNGGGAQASPVGALASAQSTDPTSQAAAYIETLTRSILPANDANITTLYGMGQYARNLNTDLDISQATGGRAGFGSGTRAWETAEATARTAVARPAVAASTGGAGAVGTLTVPAGWAESVPEVTPTAAPAASTASAAAAAPAGHGAGMAAAGLAAAGTGRRRGSADRSDAAGRRIAHQLTGAAVVRHWHAASGELRDLLGEVSTQPGVHEISFDTDTDTGPRPDGG